MTRPPPGDDAVRPASQPALQTLLMALLLAWPGHMLQADPMRPLVAPPSVAARQAALAQSQASPQAAGQAAAVASAAAAEEAAASAAAAARRARQRLLAIRTDSAGNRQALLGEHWLGVGDRLDDAQITAIDTNAVHLATAKSRFSLQLLPALEPARERPPFPADPPPTGRAPPAGTPPPSRVLSQSRASPPKPP